jgi:putative Holliday junction resolvase
MAGRQLLAFDYGLRRIGVAAGNTEVGTASPLVTLSARDGVPDWERVADLLDEWRPALLLVGLPLNLDGSDSDMAARARRFARRLHGRFGLPCELVDERLSSEAARERLYESGRVPAADRGAVDREAACLILETWLQSGVGAGPGTG